MFLTVVSTIKALISFVSQVLTIYRERTLINAGKAEARLETTQETARKDRVATKVTQSTLEKHKSHKDSDDAFDPEFQRDNI
jgi:hypothetical protein